MQGFEVVEVVHIKQVEEELVVETIELFSDGPGEKYFLPLSVRGKFNPGDLLLVVPEGDPEEKKEQAEKKTLRVWRIGKKVL